MEFKALQWNIGGGKDYQDSSKDVLPEVIGVISQMNPDIITLQEVHSDSGGSQAKEVAQRLGYQYLVEDVYDESHIEKGKMLGQAIISKEPLRDHTFKFFTNPQFEVERPNGEVWKTHDKGITTGVVNLGGVELTIQTLHMIPFVAFKIDALGEEFKENREELSNLISSSDPLLLQGDFNFDEASLGALIGKVAKGEVLEIVKKEASIRHESLLGGDRVLYKGLNPVRHSMVRDVSADHYPLVTTLSI